MRDLFLAFLVCWAALLGGCGHAPGDPPNPMLRPTEVSDFATLYKQNCAACHGANGQNGPAIDLANPEYQALVDDATLAQMDLRRDARHRDVGVCAIGRRHAD